MERTTRLLCVCAVASSQWTGEKTAMCWYSTETMKGAEHGSMHPRRGQESKTAEEQGQRRLSLHSPMLLQLHMTLKKDLQESLDFLPPKIK